MGRSRVPDRSGDDKIRLAREALAAVKAEARAKGLQPTRRRRLHGSGEADSSHGAAPDPRVETVTGSAQSNLAGTGTGEPTGTGTEHSGPGLGGGSPDAVTKAETSPPRPSGGNMRFGHGIAIPPRREDPQPLSRAVDGLIEAEGWTMAAATGSVFGRWTQMVGPELAAHTTPQSLADGELTVSAESTAWATQVRLLASQLIRRLNAELGEGTVQRVKVRGPVTGRRKPGEWRVRGGRGPRDTYG